MGTTARIHTMRSTHVPSSTTIIGLTVSPVPRMAPESTSTGMKVKYSGASSAMKCRHSSRATWSLVNNRAM